MRKSCGKHQSKEKAGKSGKRGKITTTGFHFKIAVYDEKGNFFTGAKGTMTLNIMALSIMLY